MYFSSAYEEEALCKLWANLLLVNHTVWCQYSNCAMGPEEGVFEILSSRETTKIKFVTTSNALPVKGT